MSELRENLTQYSDEKLIEMLAHREDYHEDAITLVLELLKEREVPQKRIESVYQKAAEQKQRKKEAAEEPLSLGEKVFYTLFPFIGFIPFLLLQLHYHNKGNERKKSEMLKFLIIGFVLWVIVINVIVLT